MIKVASILCIFFLVSLFTVAQIVPSQPDIETARMRFQAEQIIPPSPEAAELGKYGNIPVSLFTGLPSISIPLIELKGNRLSLPISLSYSSSGFRPQEIAPWTGLGWSLNAGGVITRSVLGEPDMNDNYFGHTPVLGPVPTDEYEKQLYFSSIRDKQKELQPDVYYYNFMGRSGKFYLYPDGTVMKKEKDGLRITPYVTSGQGEMLYIIIEDENGISYHFSEQEMTTITPLDDLPGASPTIVRTFTSAWYLSQVRLPANLGNETLLFEYYSPTHPQTTISNSLENNSFTFKLVETTDPYWKNYPQGSIYTFHSPAVSIYKKFLKKVSLKKGSVLISYIDFESLVNQRQDLGDANFDGERLLKALKQYYIVNGIALLRRQFQLGYEYFGINQSETPTNYRRLKLKTVREISPDSTITPSKPPYTFYYYNEYDNMPERWTTGLDHWGYYNGKTNIYAGKPNLIPTVLVSAPIVGGTRGLGADREPNEYSAKTTVLTEIAYPTGGLTHFDYEGHSVGNWGVPGTVSSVGGLRIKTISDFSFPGKVDLTREYEYEKEDGSSSGFATAPPYYYTTTTYENRSPCPIPLDGESTPPFIRYYSATISASSVISLGSIQGSHIGYERVTERKINPENSASLGKTVFTYKVEASNEIDDFIGNGDLLKQEAFDNSSKLLEENSYLYAYESYEHNRLINRKLLALNEQSSYTQLKKNAATNEYLYGPLPNCYPNPPGYAPLMKVPTQYTVIENYVVPQRKLLVKQTRKIYDERTDNYLVTTKDLTYANSDHNNPVLIAVVNSKNEKVFTSIKYAGDYVIGCSPQTGSAAAEILSLNASNRQGYPVEKLQYRENLDGTNRRYISGEYIEYKNGLPGNIYYLQTGSVINSIAGSAASCTTNTPEIDPHYYLAAITKYDSDGNIIETGKAGDLTTTYLWGYEHTLPVAQIIGKTYSQVIQTGISQSALDSPANEASLRSELNKLNTLQNALTTSYTYEPGVGIISRKDVTGQLTTYEYDLLNRLSAVRDNSGYIIKTFNYNYGLGSSVSNAPKSLFYSHEREGTFSKSCPAGTKILPQYYRVPYGRYVSSLSQIEADVQADAEYTTSGQALADAKTCQYYNVEQSAIFTRSCSTGDVGIPVTYTVVADKYASSISQKAANMLATTDIFENGQNYANAHGACVPGITINHTIDVMGSVTATYTNNMSGIVFTLTPTSGSGSSLVPPGSYTVRITVKPTGYYFFSLGCMSYIGNSPATFYNVNVDYNSCNTLTVGNYN